MVKQFSLSREKKEVESTTNQEQARLRRAAELQEMVSHLSKKSRSADDFKAAILEHVAAKKPLSFIARSTKLSIADIQEALERWNAEPAQLV